ncbi:MAG TPA: DoxX family protein [Candidatus Omnitrophota bacterium]|nr:DoxX family protein [Candidatus Omnitrophota bacterium]
MLNNLTKYSDQGLLFIRLVVGGMFLYYGAPMLFGGPEKWLQVGNAMSAIGINFWPAFWGFMAGFAEFFGGICIILGLFFRLFCGLLAFTMFVAVTMHLRKGDGLFAAGHAIEDFSVFLGLLFIGPGKFSLDHMLLGR